MERVAKAQSRSVTERRGRIFRSRYALTGSERPDFEDSAPSFFWSLSKGRSDV